MATTAEILAPVLIVFLILAAGLIVLLTVALAKKRSRSERLLIAAHDEIREKLRTQYKDDSERLREIHEADTTRLRNQVADLQQRLLEVTMRGDPEAAVHPPRGIDLSQIEQRITILEDAIGSQALRRLEDMSKEE